jgi:murein DD-endopeptidase MepM/ murein hydrolase activator NlpD
MMTERKRFIVVLAAGLALASGLLPTLSATAEVVTEEAAAVYDLSQRLTVSRYADVVVADRDAFTVQELSAVQWPTVAQGTTDGFGSRGGSHHGLDIVPGNGTPVMAVADAVVSAAGYDGSYGNRVVLESVVDGVPTQTLYAHMQDGSLAVSVGQSITVGTVLGLVGSTGYSTGPHLHFEVHIDGVPIDPYPWLIAHNNIGAWDWLLTS